MPLNRVLMLFPSVFPTRLQFIVVIAVLRLVPIPSQNFVNPLLMVFQSRFARAELIPVANLKATSHHGNVSANVPSAVNMPFIPFVSVRPKPIQSMPVNALPSPVAIAVPKAAKSNSSTNAFAPQMIALMAFANA